MRLGGKGTSVPGKQCGRAPCRRGHCPTAAMSWDCLESAAQGALTGRVPYLMLNLADSSTSAEGVRRWRDHQRRRGDSGVAWEGRAVPPPAPSPSTISGTALHMAKATVVSEILATKGG